MHGLTHDGRLYSSLEVFTERAAWINEYLKTWRAVGFCSPSSHHELEWLLNLDIEYDSSTFDTDPFEPQPEGVATIYPFWVSGNEAGEGFVEIPYTMPQDHTLYVLMRERNIRIWEEKLDWIAECGGLAFVNVHPDYIPVSYTHLTLPTN